MEKDKKPALPQPVSFDEFAPTSYDAWKEEATASLKGAPFEKKLLSKTYEGIVLQPLYTKDDAESFAQKNSFPGAMDYLRGVKAGGYLQQPWVIAQGSDAVLPAEANQLFLQELQAGGNGISFDAENGLYLENIDDMQALLKDICLKVSQPNVFCGASAAAFLGLLQTRNEQNGYPLDGIVGAAGADPIGVYARDGKLDASLDNYFEQMAACLRWASKNTPQLKTIYIQGSVYHNAGANAVQEIAAAMTTAIAYIDALQQRGFAIDEIAKAIRFEFSIGANFFMEIAKLRAVRVIWAQLIKAYGGSAEAAKIDVAARTSAFTATVYDPYVNILRTTTQAFSGVVGGVNAMNVAPFDAAVRKSDELSRRVARNIQIMMQEEFNLLSPVDPAGGSYYIETLTGQLAEAAWKQLQDIEAKGGIIAALADGSLQDAVAAVLADRFKKLAVRADKAVGSNMYPNTAEQPLDKHCRREEIKQARAQAAAAFAGKRDQAAVDKALSEIDCCICTVAAAFAAGATVAEVKAKLNAGSAAPVKAMPAHRWTEQFEALRGATEAAVAAGKPNIKVFLANMGPIPQHKARADFAAGFMEVAAFKVLKNNGFPTADEAIKAALDSKAEVVVICSTDDTYPELAPAIAKGVKAASPQTKVLLAGAPAAEYKDAYIAAGIDDFIHVKADCLSILTTIQKERGLC
ncbi:MAG: methylmalonyl-CoA mutase family protein [Bacillota bacterium]|nr:methylmalonyl-CoA mutase family protein [Bacillota bacterium]